MISNNEVAALRLFLPRYLAAYRGYQVKLSGDEYTMIECQICGISDNTPSAQYFHADGRALCYHTHKIFDIFDLIGEDFGLSKFGDKVRKAKEIFSAELPQMIAARPKEKPKETARKKKDYTAMYRAAIANREDGRAAEYLSLRGISRETAFDNGVGFLPCVKVQGMTDGVPAVVFPHLKHGRALGLAGRFISAAPTRWVHFGSYPFFKVGGSLSPVYIVEGETDALSVAECGGRAWSIGGTSGVDALLEGLADLCAKGRRQKLPLFLCWLDADAAGETAQQKLIKGLHNIGVFYRLAELRTAGDWKDANECLLSDRERMTAYIKKAR